jgi:hypothetical protein
MRAIWDDGKQAIATARRTQRRTGVGAFIVPPGSMAVVLDFFAIRDRLVELRLPIVFAAGLERRLPRARGVDGEQRYQLFQIRGVARRTR